MGRTSKPLVIWADADAYEEWLDLVEQGHEVYRIPRVGDDVPPAPNAIVGRIAHYWVKGMRPYRAAAMQRWRKVKAS